MITVHGSDVLLKVRVQPRASRNAIETDASGNIRIRVTAPPEDNAANEAVVQLVAKALRLARNRVAIEQGTRSRDKVLRIQGVTAETVEQLFRHSR